MRPFDGRRILLGITGGIASYKSAWLARLLTQAGAEVDGVMTRAAQEFVGAVTIQALTGRAVVEERKPVASLSPASVVSDKSRTSPSIARASSSGACRPKASSIVRATKAPGHRIQCGALASIPG